jgi:phenylacetate-CoA ligase
MAADREFFDDLEIRAPDEREAANLAALPDIIDHAQANAPYFGDLLKDVDATTVTCREALAALPVTRKSDLLELQKKNPPLGGAAATPLGRMARLFMSPGPICEPQGTGEDYWRFARGMFAAGFRPGDVVHNSFSYHLTPGGFIMDSGARALGCAVIPGGVGQTEQQAQAIATLRPNGFLGTPSFLKILYAKGDELGLDLGSITHASVGGEAVPPSLRGEFKDLGVTVTQGYGTADIGLISYESLAMEGMIVAEGIIVEILRPGTGDPVAEGEVGEVVVTTFSRDYPLIRFGTGDLSAVMAGISPCGRTNMRLKGWMGRADQRTKVKGMFVDPAQVAEVLKRHPEIKKGRLVVDNPGGKDAMTLHIEVEGGGDEGLTAAIAETTQSVCKIKGAVELASPGSLANDGKVIDDVRTYE